MANALTRPPGFQHRLESLRGLAALSVAGWHSCILLRADGWQQEAIRAMTVVLNGTAAVTLFFVLSGLVLGLSLERSEGSFGTNYFLFCLRRVLRIGPAHWVALLMIVTGLFLFNPNSSQSPAVSGWFAGHWSVPVTSRWFLANCFFLDSHLNPPSWTLRIEMLCSFALPLLVAFSRRVNAAGRGFCLLALMVLSATYERQTSRFLFMFYLGYLVPTTGRWLMLRLGGWKLVARCVAPVSLALLCLLTLRQMQIPTLARLTEAASAAVFISALMYGPEARWFRVLDSPLARLYGRISYSFYLYHMIALFLLTRNLIGRLPSALMSNPVLGCLCFFVLSVAAATLLAWLSFALVEKPGIEFAKNLCRRIVPRPALASAALQPNAVVESNVS